MRRNPAVPYDLSEIFTQPGDPAGAVVVYGGQAGSEGKGAVVGYLARRHEWGAAVCSFGPNSGHTWVGDDGTKVVTHQDPNVGRVRVGRGHLHRGRCCH